MLKRHLIPGLVAVCLAAACTRESEQETAAPDRDAQEAGQSAGGRAVARSAGEADAAVGNAVQNPYAREHWRGTDEIDNEWTDEFKAAATADERIAVIGRKQASGPEMLAPLVRLALRDADEQVRTEAVRTIRSFAGMGLRGGDSRGGDSGRAPAAVGDGGSGRPAAGAVPDEVVDLVVGAVHDPSAEVRVLAMEAALELAPEVQLEVYRQTIGVPDEDVRKMTITELGRMMSKPAFEVLLTGLQHADPAFREAVNTEIHLLVNRKFAAFDEAQAWWEANSDKFGEKMIDLGGGQ